MLVQHKKFRYKNLSQSAGILLALLIFSTYLNPAYCRATELQEKTFLEDSIHLFKELALYEDSVFRLQKFNFNSRLKEICAFAYKIKCYGAAGYSNLILSEIFRKREQYDSAEHYGLKVIRLPDAQFHPEMKIKALNVLGYTYSDIGQFSKSIECHYKASQLASQIRDFMQLALCYNGMGKTYGYVDDLAESYKCFFKGLDYDDKAPYPKTRARIFNGIGYNLRSEKKYEQAIGYLNQAIAIALKSPDLVFRLIIIQNMGDCYMGLKYFVKADSCYRMALEWADSVHFVDGQAGIYESLGSMKRSEGDLKLSLQYYKAALNQYKKLPDNLTIADIYNDVAGLYLILNDDELAEQYFNKAYALSSRLNSLSNLKRSLNGLSEIHQKNGDFRRALNYQSELSHISELSLEKERTNQLSSFETRFESKRMETEFEMLKIQNDLTVKEISEHKLKQSLYGLSIIVLLLAMLSILYYYFMGKEISMNLELKNGQIRRQQEEKEKAFEELKKTQKMLIQQEKITSLGLLTAGIAHEINNPLNFISGGIQNLKERLNRYFSSAELAGDQPKVELKREADDDIDIIQNGIARCMSIIKSLKIFTAPQTVHFLETDIRLSLDSALTILSSRLKQSHVNVIQSFEGSTLVWGNPGLLCQAFLNLVSNSIDSFKDQQGNQIIIKSSEEESWVVLTVEDNGSGITESIRNQIYDPFFTTKPLSEGTGLGLYITVQILQSHKAEIILEDILKGALFSLKLPKFKNDNLEFG